MNRRAFMACIVVAACGGEPRGPLCQVAVDCAAGAVCVSGNCVVPGTGPTFGLEIRPPPGSGLARHQRRVQPDGGPLRIQLPSPALLEAVVLDETGASSPPDQIRSRIDFFLVDPTGLPGRQRLRSVGFVPEESRGGLSPELSALDPELRYLIRVVPNLVQEPGPQAEPFPETWIGPQRIRDPDPGEVERLPLGLQPYREVRGTVVNALNTLQRPTGALVQAQGLDTGARSTEDTTQNGEFSIRLPNTPDTRFELTVTPPDAEDRAAWRHRSQVDAPVQSIEGLVLELEPTRPDLITATRLQVFGILSPDSVPQFLPDAQVTFTASASAPLRDRSYRVTGRTDDQGFVRVSASGRREIPLLAGNYVVDVEPPSGVAVRPARTTLRVEKLSSTPTQQLVLSEVRTQVRVRVQSESGIPFTRLRVRAVSLEREVPSVEAISDSEGVWRAFLDPGSYALLAFPEQDTLAVSVRKIEVEEQAVQRLAPFILPDSSEVAGILTGPDGQPLAQAEVEAFAVLGERSLSLARTRTDAKGAFELRVPQTLPLDPE